MHKKKFFLANKNSFILTKKNRSRNPGFKAICHRFHAHMNTRSRSIGVASELKRQQQRKFCMQQHTHTRIKKKNAHNTKAMKRDICNSKKQSTTTTKP